MILKGNQRGGAKDFALHLMKDENEHIEVHELRGFAAQTLMGALNEAYAVSRGTKCRQFLYSLSLNPPPQERVSTADFIAAADRAENELGLSGQPRAIVFHEKEGRRHAHVVWSRIDVQAMKAVHMFRDREKLQAVSRTLFLEHQWRMPAGLADKSRRDPRNFTLEEYQQAKRARKNAGAIKEAFQDAWAISDSGGAFVHALEERGYWAARGDRRGFVGVDFLGEVYSIPKQIGIKVKDVRERLGDASALPDVAEIKKRIADDMLPRLDGFRRQVEADQEVLSADFEKRRRALVQRQRADRQALRDKIERRRVAEAVEWQSRLRKGLGGLWDRLRGEHRRIRAQNEQEAEAAAVRDRTELDAMVFRQLDQRRHLNIFQLKARREIENTWQEIEIDAAELGRVAEQIPDMSRATRQNVRKQRVRLRRGREPEP